MTHQGRVAWLGAPYFTGLGTGHRVSVFPPLCSHWGRKILTLFCRGGTGDRRRCLGPLPFLRGLFCRQAVRTKRQISAQPEEVLTVLAARRRSGLPWWRSAPHPAGAQAGWVPSPAVLHGGCSEVAGFDGLVVPSGLRLDGGVQAYLGPPSWWLGSWFRRLGQGWARWASGCMVCLCKVRDAPRLIIPSGSSSVLAWPWPAPNSPGRQYWVGRWAQRGPHSAPKGPSPVGPQGALCACLGNPPQVRSGCTESRG